ncbi:MAG: hypothetical protein R3E64_13830 [Halioglobus sp.]
MNKPAVAVLCLWALSGAAVPALAQDTDPNQCLECHEPSEDWAGMTMEQMITAAKNPDNKRHADHKALTDEQLKLIIGTLLPPK